MRKLNLREIIGFKAVTGSISDKNLAMSAPAFSALTSGSLDPNVIAPNGKPYIEYSAGIGNILKVFRIDFIWRGTYRDVPNANNFGITGSFGFYF